MQKPEFVISDSRQICTGQQEGGKWELTHIDIFNADNYSQVRDGGRLRENLHQAFQRVLEQVLGLKERVQVAPLQ